jgi:tRNA (adenine22-N1)-methyltransferase
MMVSRRIETIASLCPSTGPLIDIGSDHGHLLQILIKKGFAFPLYASELSEASFRSLQHALQDLPVHLYQANGLANLLPTIQTVVITGMGGGLIQEILEQGKSKLTFVKTLILGPQRDTHILRQWLEIHGWMITKERFVFEEKKGYPFIVAEKGKMALTKIEERYGPWLIRNQEPDFVSWLKVEAKQLTSDLGLHRDAEKQTRLEWIEKYVKNI